MGGIPTSWSLPQPTGSDPLSGQQETRVDGSVGIGLRSGEQVEDRPLGPSASPKVHIDCLANREPGWVEVTGQDWSLPRGQKMALNTG